MSTAEAATALGITEQRVRQLIALNRLSAKRLGARAWIIDEKSVANLLKLRMKD